MQLAHARKLHAIVHGLELVGGQGAEFLAIKVKLLALLLCLFCNLLLQNVGTSRDRLGGSLLHCRLLCACL